MTDDITPQIGPQEKFMSSTADIAIYGGSAGGGKSWGLLVEALRNVDNKRYGAVFFRRSMVQVKNEGSLWDESMDIYPNLGGVPNASISKWKFPSGASITFSHLEHDKTAYNWQGSQICFLAFDELTHFSEFQFWYMLSRNRSTCSVPPYVRATCNPDSDSWVKTFIQWWLDEKTGLAIPERSGVVRWFIRTGETVVWADSPAELEKYKMLSAQGNQIPIPPKSVTFIAAKLTDNKILMESNPEYMANLLALPTVERERLLGGNWNIRPSAGLYFNRSWVEVVDTLPTRGITWVRGWDLAATKKTETNDPDWTTGTLIGRDRNGTFYIGDHVYCQHSPSGVERMIMNTAMRDGKKVRVSIPQDPAAAGKAQALVYSKMLAGYRITTSREGGDKITRFSGFSAQAEAGNVVVLRALWNERLFKEMEGFPESKHDDDVDSTSRAFNELLEGGAYSLRGMT